MKKQSKVVSVDPGSPLGAPGWWIVFVGGKPTLAVERQFWFDVRAIAMRVLNAQRRLGGLDELTESQLEYRLAEETPMREPWKQLPFVRHGTDEAEEPREKVAAAKKHLNGKANGK